MKDELDPIKIYPAEVKQVEDLCGYTLSHAQKGEQVLVKQKAFLTSYDPIEAQIIGNCIAPIVSNYGELNHLLVVIRDNEASIYRNFPLQLMIRAKGNIPQFTVVRKNQILDIVGVKFEDAIFKLDVKDGDKFLWLFRRNWNFGLYFDFSKKLKATELSSELGECYRKLEFFHLYSFFSANPGFDQLLQHGWFPFSQILTDHFEQLISCTPDQIQKVSESIVAQFAKERILEFVEHWWKLPIFSEKKRLLMAGIEAYLQESPEGTINCIKNLSTELEGIIRMDFHKENHRSPTTKELKEFITEKGKRRFSSEESLGFPGLFFRYLDEVIFRGFDLESGEVTLSRHSVGHGIAEESLYSRARALQLIFTLDQIHFYMGQDP